VAIVHDPGKNARNIALRGIAFDQATESDWSRALVVEDKRKDYKDRGKEI